MRKFKVIKEKVTRKDLKWAEKVYIIEDKVYIVTTLYRKAEDHLIPVVIKEIFPFTAENFGIVLTYLCEDFKKKNFK